MSTRFKKSLFETLLAVVIMVVVLGFAGLLPHKARSSNALSTPPTVSGHQELGASALDSHSNTPTQQKAEQSTASQPKSPEPPTPGGCNTYRPCPPTDPPEQQLQKSTPQETGTGCTSTTICPASYDDTEHCTIQDNCGANPANNDPETSPEKCTIRDNCGAQQAPDSL